MTDRPSMDEVLMHVAGAMAARSTCSYASVGCVLARDGRLLSSGYNGSPAGMPHCLHPTRVAGKPVEPCSTAVHAEANAVAFAARHGVSLQGATLYTTMTPCVACAQLIIQAGIVKVIAALAYRDPRGWDLIYDANVERKVIEL